jgi:hypothetical protein
VTDEDILKLTEKRWLARAKTVRRSVVHAIAGAMEVGEADVAFATLDTTRQIRELFVQRARSAGVREVPNRSAAIQLAESELMGSAGPAFLLPDGYDDCGVVSVDFAIAIHHLDALLASQNEIFRLISVNGDTGVCIFTQEGSAEDYSRFVQFWKTTDTDPTLFVEH